MQVQAGADFVFEMGYDLQPLGELQTYLQEHKHLPGIQSVAEMENGGVNISELQIQLLQKIEELTLYLIRQEQTIRELKERIDSLTR
ncbi:MAG: hypothetical protein NC038_04545 [Paludibacter sp.]|nr:hypothetical protein [Bacteroidales bacterium]MCM1069373.1 hypothetical protein [Prevotella sp.]MCM1353893.1 hypothetical protein [Bacteroides sp.]MCM1442857.1 hypothetical protein [Muribaculum sp.]MCM1481902.1 hypothetical protein [Paludibacter sp.]